MKFCGFIYLTVRIVASRAKVPLLVVQSLAVDCLLALPLTDHHVKLILPAVWKNVFYLSPVVAMHWQRSHTKPNTSFNFELEVRSREFQTTLNMTIPPVSQANLQAQFPFVWLCSVQNTPTLLTKHFTITANRVIDIFLHKPFNLLLSNFPSFLPHPLNKHRHRARSQSLGTYFHCQRSQSLCFEKGTP